jgi:hypothetical protein
MARPEEAGPGPATADADPTRGSLPELMFPTDHLWLVSTLWDDDWRCVGGPAALVDAILANPQLKRALSRLARMRPDPGTKPSNNARSAGPRTRRG